MHPTNLRKLAQKIRASRPELSENEAIREAELEEERTIAEVADSYAQAFSFGSYVADDIRQEVWLESLAVLALDPAGPRATFDANRPLSNFLYVHVKRRLHNLKRRLYMRPEPPCPCCPPFDPPAEPCERWHRWYKINMAKQSLAKASAASPVAEIAGTTAADREFVREIDHFVDWKFTPHMRNDYLRLKAGAPLPPDRKEAVREAILNHFAEEKYDGG